MSNYLCISNISSKFVSKIEYMTRQELCECLVACRKESGVKMKDICFQLNTMPTTIYRMEGGKSNFDSERLLAYLSAMGYGLYIHTHNVDYSVADAHTLLQTLIQLRTDKGVTQRELAERIAMSYVIIALIETEKNVLMTDTLLKICEALDATLTMVKL